MAARSKVTTAGVLLMLLGALASSTSQADELPVSSNSCAIDDSGGTCTLQASTAVGVLAVHNVGSWSVIGQGVNDSGGGRTDVQRTYTFVPGASYTLDVSVPSGFNPDTLAMLSSGPALAPIGTPAGAACSLVGPGSCTYTSSGTAGTFHVAGDPAAQWTISTSNYTILLGSGTGPAAGTITTSANQPVTCAVAGGTGGYSMTCNEPTAATTTTIACNTQYNADTDPNDLVTLPDVFVSWTFQFDCPSNLVSLGLRSALEDVQHHVLYSGSTFSCSIPPDAKCRKGQTNDLGDASVLIGSIDYIDVWVDAVAMPGIVFAAASNPLEAHFCKGFGTRTYSCSYEYPHVAIPHTQTYLASVTVATSLLCAPESLAECP